MVDGFGRGSSQVGGILLWDSLCKIRQENLKTFLTIQGMHVAERLSMLGHYLAS